MAHHLESERHDGGKRRSRGCGTTRGGTHGCTCTIPFFTVVDGLDTDIRTINTLERLSFLTDAQTEPYIQNAIKLATAALLCKKLKT